MHRGNVAALFKHQLRARQMSASLPSSCLSSLLASVMLFTIYTQLFHEMSILQFNNELLPSQMTETVTFTGNVIIGNHPEHLFRPTDILVRRVLKKRLIDRRTSGFEYNIFVMRVKCVYFTPCEIFSYFHKLSNYFILIKQ